MMVNTEHDRKVLEFARELLQMPEPWYGMSDVGIQLSLYLKGKHSFETTMEELGYLKEGYLKDGKKKNG